MPWGKISKPVHDDQEERSAVEEGAKPEEGKSPKAQLTHSRPSAWPWRWEILAEEKATQDPYLCLLQKNSTGSQREKFWNFGHKRRQ